MDNLLYCVFFYTSRELAAEILSMHPQLEKHLEKPNHAGNYIQAMRKHQNVFVIMMV